MGQTQQGRCGKADTVRSEKHCKVDTERDAAKQAQHGKAI